MDEPFLIVERQHSGVVSLTMNRPDELNALSEPSYFREMADTLTGLDQDSSVRCIILTGSGKAFCAGGNIKDMRDKRNLFAGGALEIRDRYRSIVHAVAEAFFRLSIPIIAAVNGPAIGAGCGLACMCDVRVASRNAKFAEAFVKLGIVPGDGAAWFLPRIIGLSKAMEISLTGDTLSAEQALACGLVSQVVEPEDLVTCARSLADRIAANAPHALRMTKRLIREGVRSDLPAVLELSASFQSIAHTTKDHAEALSAFFEKRKANYQGS